MVLRGKNKNASKAAKRKEKRKLARRSGSGEPSEIGLTPQERKSKAQAAKRKEQRRRARDGEIGHSVAHGDGSDSGDDDIPYFEPRRAATLMTRMAPGSLESVGMFWGSSGLDREGHQESAFDVGEMDPVLANDLVYDAPVRGCAACGELIIGDANRRSMDELEVQEVFAMRDDGGVAATVNPHSERGVVAENSGARMPLILIKNLVGKVAGFDDNNQFLLCGECDSRSAPSGRTKRRVPSGKWTLDLGWRNEANLPELSIVEKASVQLVRMYGKVVKISSAVPGKVTPTLLSGHVISFPQDSATELRGVWDKLRLPRLDLTAVVHVVFVGPKKEWEGVQPLLAGNKEGALAMRPAVVFSWLRYLRACHPLYRDVEMELDSEGTANALTRAAADILEKVVLEDDPVMKSVDRRAEDNCGTDNEHKRAFGMSEVVLQGDGGGECGRTLETKMQDIRGFLVGIRRHSNPLNEFEENEWILGGCFPWVFIRGAQSLFKIVRGRKKGADGEETRSQKLTGETIRQLLCYYDHRVDEESSLIFLLFNQMQRHRVAVNIAHATAEDVRRINEMADLKGKKLEDLVHQAFADRGDQNADPPSEEAMRVRKTLVGSIHLAERCVPFSRSEMDSAYVKLKSISCFMGCPTVWLTVTPGAVDNILALRLCAFRGNAMTAEVGASIEYSERSAGVFRHPASSALYFEYMMSLIRREILKTGDVDIKKTKRPFQSDPGVLGRVLAYTETTECQGRTLLHAHLLLWVELSPEMIQQIMKGGDEAALKKVAHYLEKVCVTKMPDSYWQWSNQKWREHERVDTPGLTRIPDGPTEVDADMRRKRLDCAVKKHQEHREHRPTCWKKSGRQQRNAVEALAGPKKGGANKGEPAKRKADIRCRMAMPAGIWIHPTCPVTLGLVKGEVVYAVGAKPKNIQCTHCFRCDCKMADIASINLSGPTVFEMNRPTVSDQILVGFTPSILETIGTNTATAIIYTLALAVVILLYLIKYNTKKKNMLENSLACMAQAIKRKEQAEKPSERTFWNAMANAFGGQQETPATMAAYALLGNPGFRCSHGFWYIFVWHAMDAKFVRRLQVGINNEQCDEDAESEESLSGEDMGNKQDIEETCFEDPLANDDQDAFVSDAPPAGRLFVVGGVAHRVLQHELYAHRPREDDGMCFLDFAMTKTIEEKPEAQIARCEENNDRSGDSDCGERDSVAEEVHNDGRRVKNPRSEFLPGFVLAGSHQLRDLSLFKVPILAGDRPPMHPSAGNNRRRAKLQKRVWAYYWATLLFPWRSTDDPKTVPYADVVQYIEDSLSGRLRPSDRAKAIFVCNVSFAFRKKKEDAACIDAWRFRAAHTEQRAREMEEAKRKLAGKSSKKRPREEENDDELFVDDEDLVAPCVDPAFVETMLKHISAQKTADVAAKRVDQLRDLLGLTGEDDGARKSPNAAASLNHAVTGRVGCGEDGGDTGMVYGDTSRCYGCAEEILLYEEVIADDPQRLPCQPNEQRGAIHEREPGKKKPESSVADDGNIVEIAQVSEDDPCLNAQQNELRRRVLRSLARKEQELIFVQGEAGTGKTFCIKRIAEEVVRLYGPNALRCLSPTGVAAGNLLRGTLTIHKGLAIGIGGKGGDKPVSGWAETQMLSRYVGTLVFVIDEISMVGAKLLECIDKRLRQISSGNETFARMNQVERCKRPFGGFTVVALGDFKQIPPVRSMGLLEASLTLGVPGGGSLWRLFALIKFHKQERAEDKVQQARVEHLKSGMIGENFVNSIPRITAAELRGSEWESVRFITATNAERHAINSMMAIVFAKRRGVPVIVWEKPVVGTIINAVPASVLELYRKVEPELTCTFVAGAPAVVMSNINPACGLANGSMATMIAISGIDESEREQIESAAPGEIVRLGLPPTHVLVHVRPLDVFSDRLPHIVVREPRGVVPGDVMDQRRPKDTCVVRTAEGDDGGAEDAALPSIRTASLKQINSSCQIKLDGGGEKTIPYLCHSVELAFAMTIHRSQGATLPKVLMCLDGGGSKGGARITYEMAHVGFTRVRRADDLRIMPPIPGSRDPAFKNISKLTQSRFFSEWFKEGMFDKDGFRKYATLPVEPIPAARAKRTTFKMPAAEEKHEPTQEQAIVVEEAVADTAVSESAIPLHLRELQVYLDQVTHDGESIDGEVINAAVQTVLAEIPEGEPRPDCVFEYCFQGVLRQKTARLAALVAEHGSAKNILSYLAYSGHFIAVMIAPQARLLMWADSLERYAVSARQTELDNLAAACQVVYGADSAQQFGTLRVECPQQPPESNICAIETANNLLEMAGVRLQNGRFTRATMEHLLRRIWAAYVK